MSLTVENIRFLNILQQLGIDVGIFPDKTFDCLFQHSPDESKYFLNWFCENIGRDNVLSDEEEAYYRELKKSGELLSDEELNQQLANCEPSYEVVTSIDRNYVNALEQELSDLNSQLHQLKKIDSELVVTHSDVKKKQMSLMEERKKLEELMGQKKHECGIAYESVGKFMKDICQDLQQKYDTGINFQNYLDCVDEEKLMFDLYNKLSTEDSNSSEKLLEYKQLGQDFWNAEFLRIISQGELEGKKAMLEKIEELKHCNPEERMEILDKICFTSNLEHDELSFKNKVQVLTEDIKTKTQLLSHLELCNVENYFLLDKLSLISPVIEKLELFKTYMETDRSINQLLLHAMHQTIGNIKEKGLMMDHFSDCVEKDRSHVTTLIDNMDHKKSKYEALMKQVNQKHPLLVALNIKLTDIKDEGGDQLQHFQRLSTSMRSLLVNPSFFPQSFYSELERKARSLLPNLLCGPTSQLQLMPIDVQDSFRQCETLKEHFEMEKRKLVNKYMRVKESISQENRQKKLLWMLFLTKPEELESIISKAQQKALSMDFKCDK